MAPTRSPGASTSTGRTTWSPTTCAAATLSGRRLLTVTARGIPDGLKVDAEGRVYASAADGVQVLAPAGELLGEIRLPGAVNFCFGGPGATCCSSPPTPRSGSLNWPRKERDS